MARKTKAKPKKTRAAKDPDLAARRRRWTLGVLVGIGGIASFVGASAGLDAVNRRAIEHLTPGDPRVELSWPRDAKGRVWLPLVEQERLAGEMMRAVSGGRALSREPLAEVGRALAESGWFEGTPSVRWTPDGAVRAEGVWRVPAAAVRIGTREHLIDFAARVLPLEYPAGESNQIFLINQSEPPPGPGEQWGGEDVRAALDLVVLFQQEGLLGQVAGVDLGRGRDSGVLSIITDRGARVVWGGGPRHLRPAEQPTSIKLDRVRQLLNRTGRIDAGVDLVDLRFQQPLIQRGQG